MTELSVSDFDAYFLEVHDRPVFHWQRRLLDQVVERGWPRLLDVPTGCGKTAALDVAVFALALDAGSAPETRRMPLRSVLVVDRRTIVDQAEQRAAKIRESLLTALERTPESVTGRVAARLASLSYKNQPLDVALLRGGVARDDTWAHSPAQPLLVLSTVDQVGSRLLFRGYGVSQTMRPIHAGLLGSDCLYLLDEVHLSQPFAQTLDAISNRYRQWSEELLPARLHVVRMSATPHQSGEGEAEAFQLAPEDLEEPVLRRRVEAQKSVTLAPPVTARGDEPARRAALAKACASVVLEKLGGPGWAGCVVVNRVDTARRVAELLAAQLGDKADVVLVTGRMRPLDRADRAAQLSQRVAAGIDRSAQPPIVVVATQCIEAGADYDFDFLVSECASLDALRQRFGRVNRLGDRPTPGGVIVVRSDSLGEGDAVYGAALAATWTYLAALETVDFGSAHLSLPKSREELAALCAPTVDAPVLLPAYLDAWAQTSQVPRPDPDVSLWLHGPQRSSRDVMIVWRADLADDLYAGAATDNGLVEQVALRIEIAPPTTLEALAVPIWSARDWIVGKAATASVSDVEGERDEQEPPRVRADLDKSRQVAVWRDGEVEFVDANSLRVGETVIVPCSWGGLRNGSWDPESRQRVADVGDRARWERFRRASLRLHPAVVGDWFAQATMPELPGPDDDESLVETRQRLTAWLNEFVQAPTSPGWLRQCVKHVGTAKGRVRFDVAQLGADSGQAYFVVQGRFPASEDTAETTTEADEGSHTGVEIGLDDHLRGVADWSRDFATRAGLPAHVIADVMLAGRWHDAGKADRRFQRLLHGGSAFKAETATELIAKSAVPAGDRERRRLASERSGYPKGCRHELASVALLEKAKVWLRAAHDPELVLHLVASHHGWCRPFAPIVADPSPVDVAFAIEEEPIMVSSAHDLARIDSGISERYWALTRRYGWFGLAWLEAVLRLADHRRSAEEQRMAVSS